MLEKLLSLFCGIGLVALLVIAGFGTANTKKQEVKAATETTIATTENSGATTAEKSGTKTPKNPKQIQKKYLATEIQKTQLI